MTRAPVLVLLMLGVFALAGPGCSRRSGALERHEYSRALMGVEARVVLWAPSEPEARTAAEAAFARIAELDRVMSDWREDSEVAALARTAGSGAQPVSPDLFRVLEKAVSVAEASDGAFDPTAGPLVALWRAALRDRRLPEPAALEEARKRTGWSRMELNGGIRTVALPAGARLDLGAIGKGFACDEALKVLRDLGRPHALVSLAGDVAAGDPPPGESAWTVAIGKGGRTVPLANAAVSTSGDAEQSAEIGGVRYSHVLDPRTGVGLTRPAWVTVEAADGMTADAVATAAYVLGEEAGRALASRYRARVLVYE